MLIAFRGRPHTRSFGKATAGVPAGNVCHRLAGGSLLAITESVAVDRTGNTYASDIAPDTKGTLSTAQCWLTSHLTG